MLVVYTSSMPVVKTSEDNGEAHYTINNGDLEAINRIKEQYGLRDSDDVITFALGVLSQSNGRSISVTKEDGSIANLLPSDQLKRQEDGNQ